MTQEDLSARLGVSQGTLSDWERARKPIPAERFAQLQTIAVELRAAFEREQAAQEAGGVPTTGPEAPPAFFDGELRANVPGAGGGPPPGFVSAGPPADAPPMGGGMPFTVIDGGAPGGVGPAGIPLAEVTQAQMVLAAGPMVAYTLVAQGLANFVDEQAGAILLARSQTLAISLVQAGDVNPYVARLVQLLQVGPVLACVALHAQVLLEIALYFRAKSRAQQQPQEGAPVAAPPPQTNGYGDAFTAAQAA